MQGEQHRLIGLLMYNQFQLFAFSLVCALLGSYTPITNWPTWRSANRPTWTMSRPTNMKHVCHATFHVFITISLAFEVCGWLEYCIVLHWMLTTICASYIESPLQLIRVPSVKHPTSWSYTYRVEWIFLKHFFL